MFVIPVDVAVAILDDAGKRVCMAMRRRHASGEFVKERDLRKHRQDVFRLLQLVIPGAPPLPLSPALFRDMEDFLATMAAEPYDTVPLGVRDPYSVVLGRIRVLFIEISEPTNVTPH